MYFLYYTNLKLRQKKKDEPKNMTVKTKNMNETGWSTS